MNKQWRAQTNYSGTTMGTASTVNKPSNAREANSLMSSTYQENNASLLSGISLALNKNKQHQIHTDGSNSATKVNTPPLFDIAQSRTPYAMSPAESMKTPGYVDPESLPFELGSDITDNTTGKQYKLLSVLGEGSYAVVYLARCSHDGAKYALKCLSKLGLSARQLSLQRTELEIHTSVCPHPHIVTLYSHFESRDWLFLVMERVAGPDLYDYITQHPAFNANQEERRFVEATRMFEQMIDAVAHIHALKAYHRDLKPENFILGADGNLKLTDFGLATRESLSTDFECGSKPYMSYENRNGGLNPNDPTVYGPRDDYSPRLSDVWALGVLLLNLLFAQSPWTDPSRESCFKFCRFLREGAGFLVSQFPKLPREVADFLVTRVFSPESGRCNVLELKQWVHDLEYPFKMPKVGASLAMAVPRPIANRTSNKVGGINGAAPRRANNASPTTAATTATTAAGTFGKSYNNNNGSNPALSGSASKKWWLPSSGAFGALPKLYQSPPAAATDTSTTTAVPVNVHAKKHIQQSKHTAVQQPQQAGNLSTSVPAHVFSQIIPATQAAAARKMMPREVNPTAAKAAAAILQSSMMGLPKNGLGQGKQDSSADVTYSGSNSDDDEKFQSSSVSMSWADQLEDLSEEDEAALASDGAVGGLAGALEHGAAAADIASKFPKQVVGAASLGFSMPKQQHVLDDFSASLDSPPASASRLRSVASVAATVTGAMDDDEFDVLGQFSDASSNGYDDDDGHTNTESANHPSFQQLPRHGHDASKINVHSASRVRFTDSVAQVMSPVSQGDRSGAHTPTTAAAAAMASNSSNSSLTATLVTSSIEYYSPHIKTYTGGDRTTVAERRERRQYGYEVEADADDEHDGNWRQRRTVGSVIEGAISSVASAAKNTSMFQKQKVQQSPIKNSNAAAATATTTVVRRDIQQQQSNKHRRVQQKPIAMHSMPAPFKHIGVGGKLNSKSGSTAASDMAAFSWADDVEELPIPSLTSKVDRMSVDYPIDKQQQQQQQQQRQNGGAQRTEESLLDEDELSDDLSWSADDDSVAQVGAGYMFFPMDM
ncbi:hypothetical protein EV175_004669 [Coemansia sp. RSA 1933]|nr:hypothetical protein EV175_004669 [Coemansia sp. RSA 1933]